MSNPPSQSSSRSGSRARHRHQPYPTDTYHGDYDASYNPNNGYYGHPEPYSYQGAQDNQYYGHGQSQSEYESAYHGSGYQDQYYQAPKADWTSSAYSNTAYASSSSAHHAPYRPMTSAFAQSLSHSQPNRPYSTSTARYTHSHSQSYARRVPSSPPSSSPPSSQPDLFTAKPFLHAPHPKSKPEDRPRRSPSPPSPSPTPTPAYLATAHTPSTRLAGPTALRRLLVLDLNGTLLLRSARRPAPRDAPPPPRRVHPRPYLPSLRAYLVHAHTRAWLDVMVWSSAQPHNVADMVRHAFGEDAEEHLLAVWARDTLGLAPDRYHRKVQTIKDLAKPWLELARLSSPPPSRPSSPAPSLPAPERLAQVHSAETTLLLDDSVRKAALQPYNHVCIREYTQTVRNADLRSLAAAALPAREDAEVAVLEGEEEDERKRRRKERKVRSMAERRAAAEAAGVQVQVQAAVDVDVEVEEALPGPGPELDETLLAVIGILHAVRWESNVAGWIFGGALWGPHGASTRTGEIKAGNDIQSGTALEEAEEAEVGEEGEEPAERAAPLWFEREEVVQYWAAKGREALAELGLEVVHGINN